MITYIKGNIFDSPAQVITNTVNTVGVMGKGIALEYKKRYPGMFDEYKKLCDEKQFDVGQLALWKGKDRWILFFPTKKLWRSPSKIEYIEAGLKKFSNVWDELNIDSIAFPKLGCGYGGLNWPEVKSLMEKYLKKLPINILIDGEVVDDMQLVNMWRIIKASGIIQLDEAKDYEHMPTLLKLMSTIDRAKMIYASKDDNFDDLPNAYQYIS